MAIKQKRQPNTLHAYVKRHLKMTLVPHKNNQYRPHLIRRYGILAVLSVIILGFAGYNFSTSGTVLGDASTVTSDVLLSQTNVEREKQQLAPLSLSSKLSQAAFLKADDMLNRQYWAHNAPDGTSPWQWFTKAGYNYAYAGENLAKNFRSAGAVMAAWLGSPEHKANIINEHYTEVGFAVVDGTLEGKPTTIVVALYGSPASEGIAGTTTYAPPAEAQKIGMITRLGVIVQSMSPAAVGAMMILSLVTVVALGAHAYRKQLPKVLRSSWYRHHGLIKAGGALAFCFVVLVLYSGGQI